LQIAVAAEDLTKARAAADELETIAQTYRTAGFRATASGARASVHLAAGEHAAAMRGFQDALATWQALDAPYDAARARLGIAEAATLAGNRERAALEYRAALATFERLEAMVDAQRLRKVMPEVGTRQQRSERLARTFMFTDIVRSTDLLSAIGDEAWQDVLRWHNRALEGLIVKNGGTVVKRTGDGFFAAYDHEAQAVEAAVAIQRTLVEHRRSAGFAPRVRIGIHAAEAVSDGRDWSGKGVHAAARIGALAEGDEIVASRGTARDAALPYAVSGARSVSLKGIAEAVEVVTIDWRPADRHLR
jgi:class 3 adenylate cyclase